LEVIGQLLQIVELVLDILIVAHRLLVPMLQLRVLGLQSLQFLFALDGLRLEVRVLVPLSELVIETNAFLKVFISLLPYLLYLLA
jgi:hypothetical protein